MERREMKVIPYSQLPTKLPLTFTMALMMFLDWTHMPPWVWGAAGFFLVILWLLCIAAIFTEKHVRIDL